MKIKADGTATTTKVMTIAIVAIAAVAVGARDQALRDDRLQHGSQLETDLLLLVRRKHGDDTVDRFGRVQ